MHHPNPFLYKRNVQAKTEQFTFNKNLKKTPVDRMLHFTGYSWQRFKTETSKKNKTHFGGCQSSLWIVLDKAVNESDLFLCRETRENFLPFFLHTVGEPVVAVAENKKRQQWWENNHEKPFTELVTRKGIRVQSKGTFIQLIFISFRRFFMSGDNEAVQTRSDKEVSPDFVVVGKVFDFRPFIKAWGAEGSDNER